MSATVADQATQGDDHGDRIEAIERRITRLERAILPKWWRVAADVIKIALGVSALDIW